MTSNIPIIVTYILYFLVILAMGVIANRRNKNLSDYVLGGRDLNGPVAALGAGASDMSGWLLMGLPGAVYLHGIRESWIALSLIIGAYINWLFIAKRLRVYTEIANDSLTVPSFFENRFRDTSGILRTVTAVVVLLFFTFYASAGFAAGAKLFESTFGIGYAQALWISGVFLVGYTVIGGFLAVNWVDLLQGILMFFALLLVPLIALSEVGGWESTIQTLNILDPSYLHMSHTSVIGLISLFGWGLGYFGQPHILMRFMAVRTLSVLPAARRICMSWMIFSLLGAVLTGLIGIVYFSLTPLEESETVFVSLVQKLFHPWIVGVLLAAVLSAVMSTIAAQLLASSSALTEDFYHRFVRRNAAQKELVWVSRITVLLVALIALLLAYKPNSSILELVSHAWAGLGTAFGPVVLYALFWQRTTRNGAVAGIIMGALGVILWKQFEHLGGIFALYEIFPGFILACLAIIIVSKMDKEPSNEIQKEFTHMKEKISADTHKL